MCTHTYAERMEKIGRNVGHSKWSENDVDDDDDDEEEKTSPTQGDTDRDKICSSDKNAELCDRERPPSKRA